MRNYFKTIVWSNQTRVCHDVFAFFNDDDQSDVTRALSEARAQIGSVSVWRRTGRIPLSVPVVGEPT